MDFLDNVMNKSNAIIRERLNNPFGQKQASQQSSQDQANPDEIQTSTEQTSSSDTSKQQQQQPQASSSSGDGTTTTTQASGGTGENDENTQESGDKFAAIAADAEAVAQKAAKGAQKFGTFLFSMANKAGQTVTQTAKQVKQAVGNTTILTDFTREQQEFIREHGGSMQAGELPWLLGEAASEEKVNDMKEQILSLSQDKRNFVRSPPQNADYQFDSRKCYPIALALLKEDPNLSKMRYELVPKLVNEDTFWCNYFYRVEMLKQESSGKRAGWASSRSSSGEGPDEITSSAVGGLGTSQSLAMDEPPSPGYTSNAPLSNITTTQTSNQRQDSVQRQDSASTKNSNNPTTTASTTTTTAIPESSELQYNISSVGGGQEADISTAVSAAYLAESSDPIKVVAEADDLKNRLRELNIGSFDGGQDG